MVSSTMASHSSSLRSNIVFSFNHAALWPSALMDFDPTLPAHEAEYAEDD
jgi:hypothetical protein